MSKRAVFEDVSGHAAEIAAMPAPRAEPARKAIFVWLMSLALLVAIMVLVGGATRLTDSGLSITEWAPVMGAIPPMSAADWEAAFDAYKTTTEYQKQNNWMTLADFKPIYWWEWGHRLLGRLIGLVWFVGFVWFMIRRSIPDGWTGRLLLAGVLGGAQGALGWWMVASGLTDRLDVAPYRLAAHLGLAFVIFALLLWYALRIRHDAVATLQARRRRDSRLMLWSGGLSALIFVQLLSGALVAGLDAGRGYVDWPLMQGEFMPTESFDLAPIWLNIFENPALAQFNHRMLAYLIVVVGVLFVWRLLRSGHARISAWGARIGVVLILQVVLGIVTVMHAAPLDLALLHQAMAMVVVGALVHARFEIAYPSEQKITA
ncbi:MAG: COX15/CtaA family protein [Pseudomonadota bacterium]